MVEGNPLLREVSTRFDSDPTLTVVTVDTSATALPAAPLKGRKEIMIQNKAGASIFIGPSDVTTSTGIELASGATLRFSFGRGQLYAIKASTSGPVHVLEFA